MRQGGFGYGDLQEWFEAASREVFAEGGVVLVDLHEASNRVLVGVESRAAEARVRAAAARAGVPAGARVVEVRVPIRVTNACVTVGVSGTYIAQRPQVIVEGGGTIIAGGDSGSPAFTLRLRSRRRGTGTT